MIGKPLAVLALGADAVDLPRLAQFAPGTAVARTASFMMHGSQPFSPPAAGEEGEISESGEPSKHHSSSTAHRAPDTSSEDQTNLTG